MTFTEIVSDICDRLNYTSTDATTRVGKAVNRKYKEITSSIGLVTARRTEVQKAATLGVSTLIFTGIEKIITVIDKSSGTNRILQERTYEYMLDKAPATSDSPQEYAIVNMGASTTSILMDVTPQTAFVLYAEGHATAGTLSGTQEPAFSESFHDVLIEGVLVDEYRKLEKPDYMKASKAIFDQRMGELRLWIAKSAWLDIYQGGNKDQTAQGSIASGGSSSSVNGATSYTQTGLITFDRDPSAPFAVTASSAVVPNLDADKVDGEHASTLHDTAALTGSGIVNSMVNAAAAIAWTKISKTGSTLSDFTTRSAADITSGILPDARVPGLTTDGASRITQLAFKAVQSASADANTLDDYEEGTWTPVIGGSGGTSGQTYSTQAGYYTKIGKLVHAQFNVALTVKGTITTDVQIQGLPFTIENSSGMAPALVISWFGALGVNWIWLGGLGIVNTTAATIYGTKAAAASVSVLATADIGATTNLVGSITYRATT